MNDNETKFDHYLVFGKFGWALDKDIELAFWSWLDRVRPYDDVEVAVWLVDENAYIDEIGTIYAAKGAKELIKITVPKAFVSKWTKLSGELEGFFCSPVIDARWPEEEEGSLS